MMHDGEKFIGKLPEIKIASNIYDMFGKDFIGMANNNVLPLNIENALLINMKIENY